MKTGEAAVPLGWRVYGLGMAAQGLLCLVFGDFDPGQGVPRNFPGRAALAYCAGLLMVLAAATIEWRRTTRLGAAVLAGYYAVFVLLLMEGRMFLSGYNVYGTYEDISMQTALIVGALIVFVSSSGVPKALAARCKLGGRMAFGLCSVLWGGAHFKYMNLTAPLVPKWLPPGQAFWGYLTGVCFIAAGLALLTGIEARLAANLLTIMIASFGLLANGPMLVANMSSHFNWTESALNLALTGAAWVVADSLPPG